LFFSRDAGSITIASLGIVVALVALVAKPERVRIFFGMLFSFFALYNIFSLFVLSESHCNCFPSFDPPISLVIATDFTLSFCWLLKFDSTSDSKTKSSLLLLATWTCTLLSIAITSYSAEGFALSRIETMSKLPTSIVKPIESNSPRLARQLKSNETTRIILLRGNCEHCRELEKHFTFCPDTLAVVVHPESGEIPVIPAFQTEDEFMLRDGGFPAMLFVNSGEVISQFNPEQLVKYLDRTKLFSLIETENL
jgi:hypothetical protein